MSITAYFIFFLLGIIVIKTIIIVVMGFIIKATRNREKSLIIKDSKKRKEFTANLLRRGAEIDKKINNAVNRNDFINIYNDIMFNKTDHN